MHCPSVILCVLFTHQFVVFLFFFFFQAEDGIRDADVTGVQTCALPISFSASRPNPLAIIHFYKGFGLEAEKEHEEDARKLASLLHKYGIRVGVYIGSTIAYETFLAEKPEAADWFVPDFQGRPVFYDDQTFRKRVYFMHPGYREYMKRVIRHAIERLQADEIDFDNTSMQAQAPIFQHPLAIEDFRNYLANKYPREVLEKRLGFSDVRYVLPPRWDKPLRTINDPLFQEWADFRCHQLNRDR